MPDSLLDVLQGLVRIPSPNPPGDTRQIAAYVADWLRGIGAEVTTPAPETKPEAVSAVGVLGSGDPVIMLHAHIDTVPIAADEARHWHVDPYAAVLEDGKLYGKGSVDDKAQLAAMLIAARDAMQAGFKGTLVVAAAAEEETGGQLGSKWLAESGHLPKCDFIVVGEQTHNRAAIAHKGVLRATVRATGKSVHATNPDRGVNAIVAMAKAVLALQAYHESLRTRVHPLIGNPTCNVGVIQGGSTFNAVPDACLILVDRRMIPFEDPAQVQDEMRAVIASVDAGAATLSIGEWLVSHWFNSTCESGLGRAFLASIGGELGIDPAPIGYLPGSDAKHLTGCLKAGGEMVVFGAGSYEVAHAYDEYVEMAELEATVRILRRFLAQQAM